MNLNKFRHRLKSSEVTRLWARIWRDAVAECYRREFCRCPGRCVCKPVSNYKLSVTFGTKDKQSDAYLGRARIFEGITRHGTLPSGGDHPKRKYDIVAEIGRQEGYEWSAEVFHSPFWTLMRHPEMGIQELSGLIAGCMYKLYPPDWTDDGEWFTEAEVLDIWGELTPDELALDGMDKMYESNLPFDVNTFDTLALIGALFKDAYLSGALHQAIILQSAFLERLHSLESSWISSSNWEELHNLAYRLVLRPSQVASKEDYPNHIEAYKKISGGVISEDVEQFFKIHREKIWEKYLL